MKYKLVCIFAWIYTIFIEIFAFDIKIFSLGFFLHQIPFLVLVIVNIVSIKKPKIGGILYLILFLGFTLFFRTYSQIVNFLLISLPLLMFGIVFLQKENRE